MSSILDRIKRGWSAFKSDPIEIPPNIYQSAYTPGNKTAVFGVSNITSIITTIYNQIAVDTSQIDFRHVKLDENGNYLDTIDDDLNRIFKTQANIDQTVRAFIIDIVESLLDEGCVALVPTFTSNDPLLSDAYDVYSARVGKIIDWYPQHVKIQVYDEEKGCNKDIVLPKRIVPIIENPFYSVMNRPNSTVSRLRWLIQQIDKLNNQSAEGKLDIIVQMPYSVRNESRKEYANKRKAEIEDQLINSTRGIAYIDSQEHIIQLNRPAENTLIEQAGRVTKELFNQLGMSENVFNGTASETERLGYYNGTISPICCAIVDAIACKWLSKTARTQGQSIMYFRDPFRLLPLNDVAEVADKFTRNEIMSSNEFRAKLPLRPSKEKNADKLHNSNLYDKSEPETNPDSQEQENNGNANEEELMQALNDLDAFDASLDELESELNE